MIKWVCVLIIILLGTVLAVNVSEEWKYSVGMLIGMILCWWQSAF